MMDSLLEITTAARSQKFYRPIEVYCVTNVTDEIGVGMIYLVVTFFCGLVVKRKAAFS